MKEIGCFVSAHGYGHATRTSAVLAALQARETVVTHIFTTVDPSVFAGSNLTNLQYHKQQPDVGFAQHNAFQIDLQETISQLDAFLPFDLDEVNRLARQCADCSFILCDISPLGIAVGKRANIPTVLVENFTWDWLYAPFTHQYPELDKHCLYLADTYSSVDYHIQTLPFCQRRECDLRCGPIFREVRGQLSLTRENLRCGSRQIVLITLGGMSFQPDFIRLLCDYGDYFFILCGQERSYRYGPNVLMLGKDTSHYHPDLIDFADITVFKCGYSSLAECYQANKVSLCIQRDNFAESPYLEEFARQQMHSIILSQADFLSGEWLAILPTLEMQPAGHRPDNGANAVADFLVKLL